MADGAITVNGAPLAEYVSQEVGREIGEVRRVEESPKVNRSIVTRKMRNTSGARTAKGHVIWERGQKATHVLVRGQFFDWLAKAPYVPSGKSILGAAEYCEQTKEFKCHECGEWMRRIGLHIRLAHRDLSKHAPLGMREYKIRHGFTQTASFVNPEEKKRLAEHIGKYRKPQPRPLSRDSIKRGTASRIQIARTRQEYGMTSQSPETANLLGKCMAQREHALLEFTKQLGRTPTKKELCGFSNSDGSHPLAPMELRRLFRVPLVNLFMRLGIPYRGRGYPLNHKNQFGACSR